MIWLNSYLDTWVTIRSVSQFLNHGLICISILRFHTYIVSKTTIKNKKKTFQFYKLKFSVVLRAKTNQNIQSNSRAYLTDYYIIKQNICIYYKN